MYLIDVINLSSNFLIYVLIFILIITFIAILFLLYTQNNAIKNEINIQKKAVSQPEIENQNNVVTETPIELPKNEEINNEKVNDIEDLQSLTRELEMIPRERTINLTPYEAEQEEKAIISYDELVSKTSNSNINYNNELTSLDNDVYFKEVTLDKKVNEDVLPYKHEEEFLESLKQLNKLLN